MRQIGAIFYVIISAALLAGCGGGGGGGTSGVSLVQDWLGTDPNAVVKTPSGITYDLRRGASDPNGSTYAANFNTASSTFTYSSSFRIYRGVISNTNADCVSAPENTAGCGITIQAPQSDLTAAWKQGWTGKDTNMLMIGSYFDLLPDLNLFSLDPHSAIVTTIAARNAPGATIYGRSAGEPWIGYFNTRGATLSSPTSTPMAVMNTDLNYNLEKVIGRPNDIKPWTTTELEQARNYYKADTTYDKGWLMTGGTLVASGDIQAILSDAVITKPAGDERVDAQYEPLNYALAYDSVFASRLLIVGAMTNEGSLNKKASVALTYSNIAGSDPNVQNRFLLASGNLPFDPTTISFDERQIDLTVSTSYSAPRVAGYVAIIRQKFPNLTAANTADILLQTARYDTLTCYPNCDKAIYGQGEASLSHALSPYGKLR